MDTIITAIIATGAIGFLAAALLVVASKLMYVQVSQQMEDLREALPGANCGVCGFGGCDGYANALAKGDAGAKAVVALDLCKPGGADTIKRLGSILGVDVGDGPAKKTAIVRCAGEAESKVDKMEYVGIDTCLAAEQMFGGPNACSFGCLGFGDCVLACPAGAICLTGGIARVNMNKCIGCEKCVATCPRGIITMQEHPVRAVVLCQNTEKGIIVRKKCSRGCIACMKCVRECNAKAITIFESLAVVDRSKCVACGHCAEICKMKCIVSVGGAESGTAGGADTETVGGAVDADE